MRPQPIWQGIAPAVGWSAVFVNDDGTLRKEPVAFWAWVRRHFEGGEIEDAGEAVLGRDALHEISFADDEDHFVGYLHESENIGVWAEMGAHILKSVERKKQREGQHDR